MLNQIGLTTVFLALMSLPVHAQEGSADDYGGDVFESGGTVVVDRAGIDDLFVAGSNLSAQSDIAGSAFLAGRSISVTGAVAGDVFAAGLDVSIDGAVAGDATLAGNGVTVGPVGGDLRASGGTLIVNGPVGGYAMLASDEVELNDVITGTLYLAARNVDFGDGARVDGRLVVFEEEIGGLTVPDSVAAAESVERRQVEEWDTTIPSIASVGRQSLFRSFLSGALVVALLASLIAVVLPDTLADLRRGLLDRPLRNLWFGFLAESVAIGSIFVFAATLIGFLLIPASLFVAIVVGFAGYVVAAYALGVGLLLLAGQPEPASAGARILAAGAGALVVSAIALIPFFGWLFALALVLAGVGAITLTLFRPAFYVGSGEAGHA